MGRNPVKGAARAVQRACNALWRGMTGAAQEMAMLETFPPASARAAANHGVGGGLLGPQGAAAEAPGAAGAELEGPGGPAAAAVAGVVNVVAPPLHMVEEVLKQQLRSLLATHAPPLVWFFVPRVVLGITLASWGKQHLCEWADKRGGRAKAAAEFALNVALQPSFLGLAWGITQGVLQLVGLPLAWRIALLPVTLPISGPLAVTAFGLSAVRRLLGLAVGVAVAPVKVTGKLAAMTISAFRRPRWA